MLLALITAPAGAGKTQYVIEQICAHCETKPLPKILVILPSGAQLVALRERLGALPHPLFGVTLADFHTLYHDILDSGEALPRLMPEAARYRVVRAVIQQLTRANQLPYFAPIANKPGFISNVAKLIADLKESVTLPDKFSDVASTPRTRDLATIYSAYQKFLLEHDLADREGMGWLTLAALASNPQLYADFDYVVADGFDEFNPTQLGLVNLFAERAPRVEITLTYQPNRLAHTRFARTFSQFEKPTQIDLPLRVPPRAEPLEHLEHYLFELDAPKFPAQDSVTITSAPDRMREVRTIARQVKRLVVDGVPTNQIGVVFRRLDGYQALVREVFAEFGIPFRVRDGLALSSNPLISALVNLLTLSANNFPRRHLLDALHSPYFAWRDLSPDDLMRIETITREAIVVQGRDAWLAAFVKPTEPLRDDEEDKRLVMQLTQAEIDGLRVQVEVILERVTPPDRSAPRDLVAWIEGLIGPDPRAQEWQRKNYPEQVEEDTTSLRIIARARNDDEPALAEIAARDTCALCEFSNVLRGIVQAAEILGEEEIAWSDFIDDLLDAVGSATYDLSPTTEGRVVISTITQTRGVPKDYVFLGGLVESEFPPRAPEDPLLTIREREMLSDANVLFASRPVRDETTLFYEAVTLARKKLYLSFPTFDDDANPLYPSPYLSAVNRILDGIPQKNLSLNDVPSSNESASLNELGVALTSVNVRREPSDAQLAQKLEQESATWRHSFFARQVEMRRESAMPHDEYSGVMRDPNLQIEFAEKFGDDYLWSASQFNEWGACGFRFFAKRRLKLEELIEPEEGLDALQLGSLYHEILEQTYRQFAQRAMAVTPTTLDDAKKILVAMADKILEDAPKRFAFRPTAWWNAERKEISRRLLALLDAEAERNADDASIPFDFEVPFGFKREPALKIRLPIGTIRAIGSIDRIDKGKRGVTLVDYKSGSTPISSTEVIQGRNLQLPVYVLAAQAKGMQVREAFFFHIRGGKTSGNFSKVDPVEWLERAKEHMNRYVGWTRAGRFAVEPNQFDQRTCAAYCEFESLCRVGRWSVKPMGSKTNNG
ncbi:MAG: exodeoxyribonuclease V subunit gamma [Chloroflexi bacterium]|nr:exodeoxyribonuclease V subunit gamma [Chloroflexota bacterium]